MSCKKGANWTDGETRTFLELVTEKSILNIIDGKKHRHIEIFRMLVPEMQAKGYEKTAEQMKLKLKNLKAAYFKCKRNNNVSGAPSTCPFYNELEIIYGSRPSAVASSNDEVGIDTAEVKEGEVNSVNDENDANYTTTEEIDEILDKENEVPAKKQKRTKTGRKSYEAMLQSHSDKWLENQKDLLNSIIDKQMEFQKELFRNEMAEQRQWEQQELAKERELQKKQTSMILNAFTKSMQGNKPQISTPFTQSTFKSLKLIPLNLTEPPSAFATIQSPMKEDETNMKIQKFYYETQ